MAPQFTLSWALACLAMAACSETPAPAPTSEAPTGAPPARRAAPSPPVAPTPPPAPAARLEAELLFDRDAWSLGEPMHFTFRVHNRSADDLWIRTPAGTRNPMGRSTDLQCTAKGDAVGPVQPVPAPMGFGGRVGRVELPAGASNDIRVFLPNWVVFTTPDAYRITCTRKTFLADRELPVAEIKEEVAVTAHAKVQIRPRDAAALGATIDRLGGRVLDPDADPEQTREAARALARIDDPRTLSHHATILADPNHRHWVDSIHAITPLDRPEVVDLLEGALKAAGAAPGRTEEERDSLRVSVVYALSDNPQPRARELLLGMGKDANSDVRLTVVHALGEDPSKGSTRRLQKFTRDDDETVASEAKRYLAERAGP